MTVKELKKLLDKYPEDMRVVYPSCSEHCILDDGDVSVKSLCPARRDGWVHDDRPDKALESYLVLGLKYPKV